MGKQNKLSCIVGLQWGDEGKGKIVDYFSGKADYVVRFNGGNNAGHTVVHKNKTFKFHHLPSGSVAGKKLLIAQGCVINPEVLLGEIESLQKLGFKPDLMIDPRVHIVMPYHQLLDKATEEWKGQKATGSLKLGIGYCYEDKNNRQGIRFEDLLLPKILAAKVKNFFPLKKAQIEKVYGKKINLKAEEISKTYIRYGKELKKYLGDVAMYIWRSRGRNILFETAHGTMLDPAFGTYPYTVAPHTISGSLFTGVGIGPCEIEVIGIAKAYTTRVGNGPFPSEQQNEIGKYLQAKGNEIGTTSGRVRRCGWLDLPQLRTALKLNNVKYLVLTKLDVLSGLKEIRLVDHYLYKGRKVEYFPSLINSL